MIHIKDKLIHPVDVQPFPGELAGCLLAVDPGMAVDPTGLAAARVGRDRGALRIMVDLLAEMPSPCPAEAITALIEAALQELWSSLQATPLVVVDASNNLALLPLLGRVLSWKRIVPLAIAAGEGSGSVRALLPVVGADGKRRHLPKWSVSRNALLGGLDALGSSGAIILPDAGAQPEVRRLRQQMQAASVEVTVAGRHRVTVPEQTHDDVLMAVAMLAWGAPMALRQRNCSMLPRQEVPDRRAWT